MSIDFSQASPLSPPMPALLHKMSSLPKDVLANWNDSVEYDQGTIMFEYDLITILVKTNPVQ